MRRAEQKENGIKLKKNWNENKKYETAVMFNIEFLRFHQTKLYWFYNEIRLISLQAIGLNTCEIC